MDTGLSRDLFRFPFLDRHDRDDWSGHFDPPDDLDRTAHTRPDQDGGQAGAVAQCHDRMEPAQLRSPADHGHGPASHGALEYPQSDLPREQPTCERRGGRPRRDLEGVAADAAISSARSRVLPRHPSRSLGGNYHRRFNPQRPRAGARRYRDRPLARLDCSAAELASAREIAGGGAARERADAVAAAAQEPARRKRERCAAGCAKTGRARRIADAAPRQWPWRDRAERLRQIVARPHAGWILGTDTG